MQVLGNFIAHIVSRLVLEGTEIEAWLTQSFMEPGTFPKMCVFWKLAYFYIRCIYFDSNIREILGYQVSFNLVYTQDNKSGLCIKIMISFPIHSPAILLTRLVTIMVRMWTAPDCDIGCWRFLVGSVKTCFYNPILVGCPDCIWGGLSYIGWWLALPIFHLHSLGCMFCFNLYIYVDLERAVHTLYYIIC